MFTMSLLGPFAAYLEEERPLTQLTAQKAQALLIYLVVESRLIHQRDSLMTLLWPDYPQKSAQQSLRQTLYLLRHAIKTKETNTPLILSERKIIRLNPDATIAVDVVQFEQLSGNGRSPEEWQQAVDLYRGDFLADFYLPDSEPFEAWAAGKRAFYQRRMQELLQRLVAHHLQNGDLTAAETAVRRQLTLDNLQESAHRQLMEILARNGRRQEALTHYENLHQLLQVELDIEPDADTIALVEALRTGNLAELASNPVPHPFLSSEAQQFPSHNLPHLLTSFIGREKELAEIGNLVTNHRLVTLTGVGGIGKTTLSIQAGHQLLETFSDGVWLIELAPVADPERVAQTAVYALGLRELSQRPSIEILLDYLQEKECLLILDNCEHLIQAAAQFAQTTLQTCPHLKILITSREVFDLPEETTYSVPPLSMPERQYLPTLEQWSQYEALRLFVDRAATVLPEFRVTVGNLGALLQICQQLDGIPLALELAAARVNVLTSEQIATRLEQRFNLLTSGNRSSLPRHQTLRALVDWSWDLLSPEEQILLRRLSVFAGGLSLEAAEVVCADNDVTTVNILDLLTQLVNKSLVIVQRKQGQEARYRLLETIRQYGQERLVEAREREKIRQQHLHYFCQVGAQAEQALVGPDQVDWLDRLEKDMDNMRAALSLAGQKDIKKGLQLSTRLRMFWGTRAFTPEGERWIEQMLKSADNVAPGLKAKALGVQSELNWHLYNIEQARILGEASLTLYRELNDPEGIAFALNRLAELSVFTDIFTGETIQKLLEESLSLNKITGNQLGAAESLNLLGLYEADKRGNYGQAREYFEKSLSINQQEGHVGGMSGDLYGLSFVALDQSDFENARFWIEKYLAIEEQLKSRMEVWALGLFGRLYFQMGEYAHAQYFYEKGITLSQRTGQKGARFWGSARLGQLFLKTGDMGRGRDLLIESMQKFLESGAIIGAAWTLERLASLAVIQEQPEKAVRIFAWADVTREAISNPRPPIEKALVDEDIANIREMIDEETFAAAYAAGQTMTMEEAIALATEGVDTPGI